jgi:hypothetical protein
MEKETGDILVLLGLVTSRTMLCIGKNRKMRRLVNDKLEIIGWL